MRLTKTLERLAAHGATIEQLIEVVRVHEEELEEELASKREKERVKKRKQRMVSRDVPGTDRDNVGHMGTNGDLSPPLNGFPPAYIITNNNPPSLNTPSLISSFGDFWTAYPRKIGKGAALKAFKRALAKTDAETILKAVKGYPWPSEREYIPHASTWLNGERWSDETAPIAKPSETYRIGHPKGLVKPEPPAPELTEEQKAERRRFVENALKGFGRVASGNE